VHLVMRYMNYNIMTSSQCMSLLSLNCYVFVLGLAFSVQKDVAKPPRYCCCCISV